MRPKLAPQDQMTIEEFLALTDSRPDEERWELIEGMPVMNPSPTSWHQIICGNIYMALGQIKLSSNSRWVPALGIGTRVPISPRSLPQPDVMVFQHPVGHEPLPMSDDALVLFEVLSKSNTKADQASCGTQASLAWRKRVNASVPNCEHYVTVAQGKVEVTRFDRATGWQGAPLGSLGETLDLPALGSNATIPVADIYRWTPLAGGHPGR